MGVADIEKHVNWASGWNPTDRFQLRPPTERGEPEAFIGPPGVRANFRYQGRNQRQMLPSNQRHAR